MYVWYTDMIVCTVLFCIWDIVSFYSQVALRLGSPDSSQPPTCCRHFPKWFWFMVDCDFGCASWQFDTPWQASCTLPACVCVLLFFFSLFWNRVSVYNSGWSGSWLIDQAGFKLTEICLDVSSWAQGIQRLILTAKSIGVHTMSSFIALLLL